MGEQSIGGFAGLRRVLLLRKMRRCGDWSRSSGNDDAAVWRGAGSPMNLGQSKRLLMIRIDLSRLLTSCGAGVGASERPNERPLGSYRYHENNAVYNADCRCIDGHIHVFFRVPDHSPEARERYFKRYTTVVSVSARSGVGSPYISHECPAD